MSYYPVRKLSHFEIEVRRQFEMAQQEEQPFCLLVLEKATKQMTFLNVGINATQEDVAEMIDNLMHNQLCKNSYTFLAVLDTTLDFGAQWIRPIKTLEALQERPFVCESIDRDLIIVSQNRIKKEKAKTSLFSPSP